VRGVAVELVEHSEEVARVVSKMAKNHAEDRASVYDIAKLPL